MVLIADSGSTKTHWRFLDGDHIEQHETIGLHPGFIDEEVVKSVLKPLAERYNHVNEVYFYGSGCAEDSFGQTFCNLSCRIIFRQQRFMYTAIC